MRCRKMIHGHLSVSKWVAIHRFTQPSIRPSADRQRAVHHSKFLYAMNHTVKYMCALLPEITAWPSRGAHGLGTSKLAQCAVAVQHGIEQGWQFMHSMLSRQSASSMWYAPPAWQRLNLHIYVLHTWCQRTVQSTVCCKQVDLLC